MGDEILVKVGLSVSHELTTESLSRSVAKVKAVYILHVAC